MTIHALVFAIMAAIAPTASRSAEARAIGDAIAVAVDADPQPPVFRSREADAAVLVYTAWRESEWHLRAVGDHGRSLGAFQLQRPEGRGSARAQAAMALRLMHWAAETCPDLPMAGYLSGRCDRARAQAGKRMNALARVFESVTTVGVADGGGEVATSQ